MNRRDVVLAMLGVVLHPAGTFAADDAANGCALFRWDITRELAVMRTPPTAVAVRTGAGDTAVPIEVGRHYAVTLLPQNKVSFVIPPARPARDAVPHGGSVSFSVKTAGRYRISLTSRHWIDVVVDGTYVNSSDHEGSSDCELLHKVVEFQLPAGKPLTLQMSGRGDALVGLAITPSPG